MAGLIKRTGKCNFFTAEKCVSFSLSYTLGLSFVWVLTSVSNHANISYIAIFLYVNLQCRFPMQKSNALCKIGERFRF
jgi:hypothetical protein